MREYIDILITVHVKRWHMNYDNLLMFQSHPRSLKQVFRTGGKINDHTLKLQLHDEIYRLRFYSNSLIRILSFLNSHNNVASIQKNRGDKSHCVIAA